MGGSGMTRVEALKGLLSAAETGTMNAYNCGEYGDAWPDDMPFNGDTVTLTTCLDAFDGSLDAAKELHKAVLPGWDWDICSVNGVVVYSEDNCEIGALYKPSRNWLIAILKALIAQEEEG
jgi:hypothetical protein